ncbi:hypothetical protein [Methylobacterium sp. Leaf85]|uniref:hypothetical protein n=1 Tax=Methylobacterium sp. Leaf85 TaxID=1736241 RepID=UPI000A5329F8|nr:hypothetical protein [Methylobacterium sp. Leaf85]
MADELGPLGSGPIRWPGPGDKLFTSGGPDDALLTPHHGLNLMATGYLSAAGLLVEKSIGHDFGRDTLVWPIVFLYRQYLELELKEGIADFGAAAGIDANWTTHDLRTLWRSYKRTVDHYEIGGDVEATKAVARAINEFAEIDPGSFSFRFPVNRDGSRIARDGHERIDLERLRDVMRGISNYLSATSGLLTDMIKAWPDDGPEYDGPEY